MRKVLRFLVLLFAVTHLSSCENIHRRNYFVEGEFSGLNVYNTNEKYYLSVSEISQEEYETAQGINVVNDVYKKKYYALDLYFIVGQSDEKNDIVLLILKDYGTPIRYEDHNRIILMPFCGLDSRTEEEMERDNTDFYKAEFPSKDSYGLSAYVNFYKGGN